MLRKCGPSIANMIKIQLRNHLWGKFFFFLRVGYLVIWWLGELGVFLIKHCLKVIKLRYIDCSLHLLFFLKAVRYLALKMMLQTRSCHTRTKMGISGDICIRSSRQKYSSLCPRSWSLRSVCFYAQWVSMLAEKVQQAFSKYTGMFCIMLQFTFESKDAKWVFHLADPFPPSWKSALLKRSTPSPPAPLGASVAPGLPW